MIRRELQLYLHALAGGWPGLLFLGILVNVAFGGSMIVTLLIVVSTALIVWHARLRRQAKRRRLNLEMAAWVKEQVEAEEAGEEGDVRWRG